MNEFIILLSMIFMHIVDDYYLQGILANMKQKKWWKLHEPDKLYQYDYIAALIFHAFSWTFAIHIPIFILYILKYISLSAPITIALFIANIIIHAYVDNLKANKHEINLIMDQSIHLIQIMGIWVVYFI